MISSITVREIFFGIGSLVALTYLLITGYIIFMLIIKKGISDNDKVALKSMIFSFVAVAILIYLRGFFPELTGYDDFNGVKYLYIGSLFQVFLPFQLLFAQRHLSLLNSSYKAFFTVAAALVINTGLMIVSHYANYQVIVPLSYLLNLLFASLIIFQLFRIRELYELNNGDTHSEKLFHVAIIWLFVSVSAITLFLLLMTYLNISPVRRDGLRLLLYFMNIVLFVIFRYNMEFRIAPVSGSDNNFFRERRSEELVQRLINYFDNEKPYLKNDLTINEVALYLYSNKTYLSRTINENFNNNFSQFVNYYRIEEAKRLFLKDQKLSIHQLCDLSGFGSQAAFNMAFRFFVGKSPADWCKEQKIRIYNEKRKNN